MKLKDTTTLNKSQRSTIRSLKTFYAIISVGNAWIATLSPGPTFKEDAQALLNMGFVLKKAQAPTPWGRKEFTFTSK